MAYLIETTSTCRECDKRATVRVYNNQNAPMGNYCKHHGEARVKELRRIEAELTDKPAATEAN